MDDQVEWKEAKSGQNQSDSENEELDAEAEEINDWNDSEEGSEDFYSEPIVPSKETERTPVKKFHHDQLNLILKRNITSLADATQHKSKPCYSSGGPVETFANWIEETLVTISPTADLILFSKQSPQRLTFFAKLRMEPINQYITKPLEIPIDYDEQVTSLLCLPIMSTQKTALGLVDWTALVVGLSSGYIKFYTEQSLCLLNLKFHDEPVIGLKCQTLKSNTHGRSETHFANLIDEILVIYKSSCILIDGLTLFENLRLAKIEVIHNDSNYEPAYNMTNLPSILNCQRWKLDQYRGSTICDGDILGSRRTTLFDSLKSESINFENIPTKACARTLAFTGRDPFLTCYRESTETTSQSYTEMIGSLFSLWNKKPAPQRVQLNEVSEPNTLSLFDRDRQATSITTSPDKRLVAITDEFGRILLFDATNSIFIRMWKGYRSAQCGWIEAKKNSDIRSCPRAFFLVIYAPKRGLLEVWSAQRGPRVAAYNVGKSCCLLYSNFKMLNMRADKISNSNPITEQSYSSHCYLLNAESETVFSVELPYTYSLYKYDDLKSRDHLLIDDLVGAIQQEAEIPFILELLHRVVLAESLQTCIHKIVYNMPPEKIILIMENLIIKIMRQYDNHSGQSMTHDDKSIIELCKRVIKLSTIFQDLTEQSPQELSLPDVNQRLIDQYEEHPQEIDEFSDRLGWSTFEVLRYISLLALERSYRDTPISNPWPSLGEPLAWNEFIDCFDLERISNQTSSEMMKKSVNTLDIPSIRLRKFESEFLNEDKVMKTAIFMYNRFSETFYRSTLTQSTQVDKPNNNCSRSLEPSSRLALLLQFWLSTKLSYHWKMWSFLQAEIGQISDELKIIAKSQEDDTILVETWKRIYELILESDNLYAAIIATAVIKSDTLRVIRENEEREKASKEVSQDSIEAAQTTKDWECLCIDAERMSLLSQQLEDVFLLSLLLRYSPSRGHVVDSFVYKVPRISVANIHRNGPTVVSELVAQWVAQTGINLKIFKIELGDSSTAEEVRISGSSQEKCLFTLRSSTNEDFEEHAKELLNYTKASFPCSLESDVILLNCFWEFCRRWTSNGITSEKMHFLIKAHNCLSLLSSVELRHKLACVAYKTFFQRTFERLVLLVETNSTILNVKSSRLRDNFTRKELNMADDCLEEFVQFCCNISEFMLQTINEVNHSSHKAETNLKDRLLNHDDWWCTPDRMKSRYDTRIQSCLDKSDFSVSTSASSNNRLSSNSLVNTTLSAVDLFNVDFLVELNSLANLMSLIFRLRIVKAYPVTLIGEESRQILQLNIQQLPAGGGSGSLGAPKIQSCSLNELRQKFARKCILNLVSNMTEDSNEFSGEDEYAEDNDTVESSVFECGLKKSLQQAEISRLSSKRKQQQPASRNNRNMDSSSQTSTSGSLLHSDSNLDFDDADEADGIFVKNENNESMVLFANLLSLATEWELNRNDLYLELVFELYRCNHDKIALQISNRVQDQQTLANGLLKISSQRVLVLFGLSPQVSGSDWRRRSDKWSVFQPSVASWLRSIQQEELKHEIASLNFSDSLKLPNDRRNTYGLQTYVLQALRKRTMLVLENVTNHLDGQASRLAYDLLQLLESQLLDKLLSSENELSPED